MKNAAFYEKKIRKLLSGLPKVKPPAGDSDPVRVMIEAILQADASHKQAAAAMERLEQEFLDLNELRVAPERDIIDCVGRDYPGARDKAERIGRILNAIFSRKSSISVDYMRDMTKRDLRRHLLESGLDTYSAAAVVLLVFGGHAVPVDRSLVESLEMGGLVYPGSTAEDVQGFLERVVQQKDDLAVHDFLRKYVERSAKGLRKRRAEAEKLAPRPEQPPEPAPPAPKEAPADAAPAAPPPAGVKPSRPKARPAKRPTKQAGK